jgi:APA family basic amino acid/polyamine antiporter
MTEEVRSPARDLPPAIVISIGATTLLYVLVSLAVVTLAAPAELAGSTAPLALAIEKTWPGAGQLVSAIALFATANTVLITLIATSRLAFSMSRDGEIPRIFGKVLPHRHTPWAAALLTLALSAVLIPIGSVKILAEFSSFSALLAFFAVNVSLIVLRYRLPEHHRPFRLPLSIGRTPLLPLLAIASICLLLANFEPDIYLAGAIVLMLTIIVSLVRKYRPRRPSAKR